MRRSVLTGVLIFGVILFRPLKTNALETQTNAIEPETTQVVELLNIKSESAVSVLKDISEPNSVESDSTTETKIIINHVVTEGETLSSIANQYGIDWKRIFDKNTQLDNPNIISAGTELVIPQADEQLTEREIPVVKAVVARISTVSNVERGSSTGNGYTYGYCTWYVKNRRPDLPNNLGNALTWVSRASSQGIPTGSQPVAGAVGQHGNHVVYVESVNDDGTVTVSEMNHVGWNIVSTRTVSADYFSYIY
ncbi:LysM peptidoglycan-binding domain-containing protein [Candidatus Saccharibacteria bacterium]|nr:LysM peptidoglycan-binding domain-containing protein [Candidatus Saccharibacteria bacterium]